MRHTRIVNLFAGPGAGKSTLAAGLFHKLKSEGVRAELVTEFAKDLTWGERFGEISNPVYVAGCQWERFRRLIGKVDWIVTDSPILLASAYVTAPEDALLCRYIAELHERIPSHNFLVERHKEFVPEGRNQTEEEARGLDTRIHRLLQRRMGRGGFIPIPGSPEGVDIAYSFLRPRTCP